MPLTETQLGTTLLGAGSSARRPTCRVVLTQHDGGKVYELTKYIPNIQGAISLNQQFGQPIGGGSVQLRRPPISPSLLDIIEIHLGWNDNNTPVFTGFVVDPGQQAYPNTWTVQVADILWLADFPSKSDGIIELLGPGGTPNNVPATEAIIRLLRDWAGIPEFRIHIPSFEIRLGEPWILGQLSPVSWSGASPLTASQGICEVLGYWLYCDGAGHVRCIKVSGAPSESADFLFEEGQNILVRGGSSIDRNISSVVNKVIVIGGNTLLVGDGLVPVKDARQADLFYMPSGKYRELSYSNSLIEYVNVSQSGDASCEAVAKRFLGEHSRLPATIQATIKGDALIGVGKTVSYKGARIGYPNAKNFFVYARSISFGGGDYSMQVTLDGGVGSEGYTTIPPPTAAFTFKTLMETLDGVDTYEVFVDGSSSFSPTGEVITWAWTAFGGTPPSGTGQYWTTRVPSSFASIDITLIVTDTTGKQSDPYTQHISFDTIDGGVVPTTRKLSFAAGNTWFVTPDGGHTWNSEASSKLASCVPPIGAGGDSRAPTDADKTIGLLANGAVGGTAVRRTRDLLATPSTQLVDTSHLITFLWQGEIDPTRVWAAIEQKAYLSTNGGTLFTATTAPTFPILDVDKDVRWIVESADQIGTADILAGRHAFTTFDNGVHWITQLSGPLGAVARCYISGQEKHWVGYTGMPEDASPLRSFEGDIATFPVVDPLVTDVRAVTMLVETPDLFAFDGQGRIWRLDVSSGTEVTQWGVMPDDGEGSPDIPQHAIRDGDYRIIYVTGTKALYKMFVDTGEILVFKEVAEDGQGWMAGYAGLGKTPKFELLLPAYGSSVPPHVDVQGVWHYKDATWTRKFVGFSADLDIIAVVTRNAIEWVAMAARGGGLNKTTYPINSGAITLQDDTETPFWYTNDAGAHWVPVSVSITDGIAYNQAVITGNLSFLPDGSWGIMGLIHSSGGSFLTTAVYDKFLLISGNGQSATAYTADPPLITNPDHPETKLRLNPTNIDAALVSSTWRFVAGWEFFTGRYWAGSATGTSIDPGSPDWPLNGLLRLNMSGTIQGSTVVGLSTIESYVLGGGSSGGDKHPWAVEGNEPDRISTDELGRTIASSMRGVYIGGRDTLLRSVDIDAFKSATWTEETELTALDPAHIGNVRADRQSGNIIALRQASITVNMKCAVNDGTGWLLVDGPDVVHVIQPGGDGFVEPIDTAGNTIVVVGITIVITPSTATINVGQTQQFTAVVSGTADLGVVWSVVELAGAGTIDTTGLYTAPTVAGTYHVRATSHADSSRYAQATIVVGSDVSGLTIDVSPETVTLEPSGTTDFVATVVGSGDTSVTWRVNEVGGGTINSSGHYTAPAVAGTFHIRATSNADTSKFDEAVIIVQVVQDVVVTPAHVDLPFGGTQLFVATPSTVDWSVDGGAGNGTITSGGLYTAPSTPVDASVLAQTTPGHLQFGSATITVRSGGGGTGSPGIPDQPSFPSFVRSSRLPLVWVDSGQVVMRYLTSSGYSDLITIIPSGGCSWPSVAIKSDSTLHIVYSQGGQVKYTIGTVAGDGYSFNSPTTIDAGEQPFIHLSLDTLYIAWKAPDYIRWNRWGIGQAVPTSGHKFLGFGEHPYIISQQNNWGDGSTIEVEEIDFLFRHDTEIHLGLVQPSTNVAQTGPIGHGASPDARPCANAFDLRAMFFNVYWDRGGGKVGVYSIFAFTPGQEYVVDCQQPATSSLADGSYANQTTFPAAITTSKRSHCFGIVTHDVSWNVWIEGEALFAQRTSTFYDDVPVLIGGHR